MFNVAVLPFRVLSNNHKIHIFMSKNINKKNVCWSVNDTKPKAKQAYIHIITTTRPPSYYYCHLVRSVGKAPVCWVEGRGFKLRPDQHSGSLNNWRESASFAMTSSNS